MELARLHATDEPDFHHLVRLYTEAFPASERKPVTKLHRMLHDSAYRFFAARQQDTFVGFAIARHCAENEVALLEYMAISPDHRGQGLGRKLYEAAAQILLTTSPALLIEIESDHLPAPDQALRTRRKAFYRRHGARQIDGLRWIMPTVAETAPPAMDLLLHGDTTGTLPKATLHRWLQSIYAEVYAQSRNDPHIAAMLAPLPDSITLA